MPSEAGVGEEMQLTPEQHRSPLPGATYTWGFFNKYIGNFFEICDNLKKLTTEPCCLRDTEQIKKKLGMSWTHKMYVGTSLFYRLLP